MPLSIRFLPFVCASIVAAAPLVARAQQPVQPVPIYVNPATEQPAPPPVPSSARAPNGEYVAPLQQQTQTTYVPQSVALSGPKMIKDWEPGEPIPQGYHPETRTRTGLIIAGGVTFGTLYLLSAFVAAVGADASRGGKNELAAMWVPVAGPFIQMGQLSGSSSTTASTFLVVDGLGQVAGAAMLIAGLTIPRNVLIRNDLGARVSPVGLGNGKLGWGIVGEF